MHDSIAQLMTQGWTVVHQSNVDFVLPKRLQERYRHLPSEVTCVLSGLKQCVAPDEQAWLLCLPDFAGESDSAFRWNEWELLSLESADGDKELVSEIRAFWDVHLPFYFSVRDGYEYAAICLAADHFGQVVSGVEPEFEDATYVSKDIMEFLECLIVDQ